MNLIRAMKHAGLVCSFVFRAGLLKGSTRVGGVHTSSQDGSSRVDHKNRFNQLMCGPAYGQPTCVTFMNCEIQIRPGSDRSCLSNCHQSQACNQLAHNCCPGLAGNCHGMKAR